MYHASLVKQLLLLEQVSWAPDSLSSSWAVGLLTVFFSGPHTLAAFACIAQQSVGQHSTEWHSMAPQQDKGGHEGMS